MQNCPTLVQPLMRESKDTGGARLSTGGARLSAGGARLSAGGARLYAMGDYSRLLTCFLWRIHFVWTNVRY